MMDGRGIFVGVRLDAFPERQALVLGDGTGLDLGVADGRVGGAVVKPNPNAFGRPSLMDGALVDNFSFSIGVAGMLVSNFPSS